MPESLNAYRLRDLERKMEDLEVPPCNLGEDPMLAIVGAALSTKTAPLYHYLAQALDRIDELEKRLAELETKGANRRTWLR